MVNVQNGKVFLKIKIKVVRDFLYDFSVYFFYFIIELSVFFFFWVLRIVIQEQKLNIVDLFRVEKCSYLLGYEFLCFNK